MSDLPRRKKISPPPADKASLVSYTIVVWSSSMAAPDSLESVGLGTSDSFEGGSSIDGGGSLGYDNKNKIPYSQSALCSFTSHYN